MLEVNKNEPRYCYYCGNDTVVGKHNDENTGQWENTCRECATEHEREDLFRGNEKQVALYITNPVNDPAPNVGTHLDNPRGYVTNWLGTIKIPAIIREVDDNRVSWMNGGKRRDAYFRLGNRSFVGRVFGDMDLITQLVELKR
jgi:hypothetical protein